MFATLPKASPPPRPTPTGVRAAGSKLQMPEIGCTVDGRYLIEREIAAGGMSQVYQARHVVLNRTVALKLALASDPHPSLRERILREATALAEIVHPNVVAVHDAGVCETYGPYLALEYLRGRTLDGLLAARTRLSASATIRIGRAMASALAASHARGVLHRDVKPGNVFLAVDGGVAGVKLFDFGLASLAQADVKSDLRRLTRAGAWLGTAQYMPPEQMSGTETLDGRADVYALGVTLYECLTGTVPFDGSYIEIAAALGGKPTPPVRSRNPDVPEALARVVEHAIARDKADRFPDMAAFEAALAAAAEQIGSSDSTSEAVTIPLTAAVPVGVNQRKYDRAPYVTPVRVQLDGGETLDGRSEDMSVGGVLVVLQHGVAAGTLVSVKFALPTDGTVVTVRAVVRWAREAFGRAAIGLEFQSPPDAVRAAVSQFIELMVPRGG